MKSCSRTRSLRPRLADQVKSLDWRARKARKKGAATKAEVAQALAKARTLLQ
ncbi:MAG: hypothetical protein WA156_11555 [Methylocystis silviterrae]